MSPLHAALVGGAVVVVGAFALVLAMAALAGRDDDEQGRPRG